MDLRIFTEPQQGASHADLLAVAQATRAGGFSAFFRSDHILAMGAGDGLPGPSDSMVSLGALASSVPDIRFGTLVTAATFRHPSMLAIAAATIDDISGGRLDLGLGAGWYEAEHRAYGVEFGSSFGERFDRMTEQLEILTGLWGTPIGERFDHEGRYYQLAGAPGLPKPIQTGRDGRPRIPLVLGGHGPKRTPALAARFADDFNVGFSDLAATTAGHDRVRAACEAIGRDPGDVVYSAALPVCCGSNPQELARRAAAIGRDLDELRSTGLAGSPAEVLDQLGAFAAAGTQRMYLQVLDLHDLDHIALLGEHVRPAIADR
ncbi:probable F420-dependent oxidoreductase, Rv1855c family [Nakamurella panacisegetis]|uniref:Probable F420-dependent oxidoreductase, Rv1855c family n=1 Tax=Nakamurella panacisegetis TaxID=1090615 RepID=A0A1H0JL06_9ACTN|nr:LLM class F420-dependent oxidoreductase [Nakamurella panacisegetis]SDO44163.1 probable F420-dependent oxidoreductase, Rv1855c family [Nakamurella panacisegetis]